MMYSLVGIINEFIIFWLIWVTFYMSTWHTLLFGDGVTYAALLMFKDVILASLLILQ